MEEIGVEAQREYRKADTPAVAFQFQFPAGWCPQTLHVDSSAGNSPQDLFPDLPFLLSSSSPILTRFQNQKCGGIFDLLLSVILSLVCNQVLIHFSLELSFIPLLSTSPSVITLSLLFNQLLVVTLSKFAGVSPTPVFFPSNPSSFLLEKLFLDTVYMHKYLVFSNSNNLRYALVRPCSN